MTDTSFIIRLQNEYKELTERLEKLQSFINSDKLADLHIEEVQLLLQQGYYMSKYAEILDKRVRRHEIAQELQ